MQLDLDRLAGELDRRLAGADRALAEQFPGARAGRQPVHTVYVPADRYAADLPQQWGSLALAVLAEHQALFTELITPLGLGDPDGLAERVRAKLAVEPIEDLRVDFEDGYGARPDEVEDADAARAAAALATAPPAAAPFTGIRIKSFEAPTRARGLRTLTTVLAGLAERAADLAGFVITLPKVTSVDQVEALVYLFGELETQLGLTGLRFEIQVETPQSILGPDGSALVARMLQAADGRCTALHYGTYDYSAFCGIAAGYQSLEHPVADHAKLVMQAAAAGTGVRLSDGSTNILPVGDPEQVRHGWQLHLRLIRRSLERGYYQGWDLHPAQLPTRYAATFAFYRQGFSSAAARLRDYLSGSTGAVLDEPATARALADYLLRAQQCGAVTDGELESATGAARSRIEQLARPGR